MFPSHSENERRRVDEMGRLVPFLRRSNQLPVSTMDKTNISAFKTTDDIVFIAYLAAADEQLKKIFTSMAKRNRHRFSFGISTDPALAKAENILLGCILHYNNEHKEQEMLCGENGIVELERWVEKVTTPLIGEMTRRNELKYLKVGFATNSLARQTLTHVFESRANP
jgi:protein disulfide-isomerase A1